MIKKSLEFKKLNKNQQNFFLFYGKNDELIQQATSHFTDNKKEILSYEEKEVLDNTNNFIENTLTKSLFTEEKIILIKRATDKIITIIQELSLKNIDDITLIIIAESLEKRSKLRFK